MTSERHRFELFGVPFDALTMDETVEVCREAIDSGRYVQHVVLNASKVVMMEDDPDLQAIVAACDVVNADGQSIVWAGRWLGVPVPERVAGIDLMGRLIELAADEQWPVYFLGAHSDVIDAFASVALARHPALKIAGARDGYFDDDEAVAQSIAASGARLLFVGISSPRKERFLATQRDALGPLFTMGVGGSFDVWAGLTRRAPLWMQKAGLEWFYRFLQEPARMWKRYLVGNTRFARIVLRERFGRQRGGGRTQRPSSS